MTAKEKLRTALEVIFFPIICIWAFVDGFFIPGRIERAAKRAGHGDAWKNFGSGSK